MLNLLQNDYAQLDYAMGCRREQPRTGVHPVMLDSILVSTDTKLDALLVVLHRVRRLF